MGGMAIIATFCGVFSGCFISYLEADRAEARREAACRRAIVFMRTVRAFQRAWRRQKDRLQRESLGTAHQTRLAPWKRAARNIAYGMTPGGQCVLYLFNATLVVAIVTTMVASLPETSSYPRGEYSCLAVQMLCTVVFVLEYLIRVAAYPAQATSFWRMLDLVCCFPSLLKCLLFLRFGVEHADAMEAWIEALSMVRALRILEFQYFRREVAMIADALKEAAPKLVIPGYLALCVWIVTSALFMWLENYFKDERTNVAKTMTSIPDAMYWCCIFLTGEWANVDFTYAGSRLCIFYVLFGIAMFSIPVGILVEAVQTTVLKASQESKEAEILMCLKPGGAPGEATVGDVVRRFTAVKGRRSTAEGVAARASLARPRASGAPQDGAVDGEES
mmetsp:Transcript_61126/g.191667  ORF Transcript_61126/g.191667 Transcript_61126/m.191667 type:complete len:390 (-) Transcript_61126:127-1296(-)